MWQKSLSAILSRKPERARGFAEKGVFAVLGMAYSLQYGSSARFEFVWLGGGGGSPKLAGVPKPYR